MKPGSVPENFYVFSASSLEEIASGTSSLQPGIFSFFLMKGLEGEADGDNDNVILNSELYDYLKRSATSVALGDGRKQTPTISGEMKRAIANLR